MVRAEKARRSLPDFIRYGWHVLEPTTPLTWNWHMDAIALHVQAAVEGWMEYQRWAQREQERDDTRPWESPEPEYEQLLQNVLFNVPPGSAKSRIIGVFTTPWVWLHWPTWRALFLSTNPDVALRDSVFCREVIESDWYQSWFRPEWQLAADQNAKSFYRNTEGGLRRAKGYFAKITGDRYDALFVDDPNDPQEAHSDTIRTSTNDRWTSTIYNRVNDLRSSLRVGIQQRVYEDDWSGHVMKEGTWERVIIPMKYEPRRLDAERDGIPRVTSIGWSDPRTKEGELMFPARFPKSVVEAEEKRLGSYGFAGQHQQRPSPAEGGMLKRKFWRFWHLPGQPLPPVQVRLADGSLHECPVVERPATFDEVLQSWDMSFKDTKASAFVAGQVWGRKAADKFLLDQVRAKLDFTRTLEAVRDLSTKWPKAAAKLVEDKANGPAVISALRSEIAGLIAVEPDGSKEARAAACSPQIEAGNVYLPHPALYAWVEAFIDECATFPNGAYKDQVDAMTQALIRMLQMLELTFY